MGVMSISQFAKEIGVSVETIRFYERRGLIKPASRKANGYRVYGPDELRRVRRIRAAKAFTFTLRELEQNASLVSTTSCNAALRKAVHSKLQELDGEIARLQKVRSVLKAALRRCATTQNCPCLDELASSSVFDAKHNA